MTLRYDHLVGRSFVMGVQDCFQLGREFFADNFDIQIPDFARPQDWSSTNLDLVRHLYTRSGFQMITDWTIKDLRPADVMAMCVGESNPNHFAIVVDNNQILHHLANRLSNVEVLRDFWRHVTAFVLRHPDVPDLRPVHADVDIRTLLNARYSLQTSADADGGGDT